MRYPTPRSLKIHVGFAASSPSFLRMVLHDEAHQAGARGTGDAAAAAGALAVESGLCGPG